MSYELARQAGVAAHNHVPVPRRELRATEAEARAIYHETRQAGRRIAGLRAVTAYAGDNFADVHREFQALASPDDVLLNAGLHDLEVTFLQQVKGVQKRLFSEFGF